MLWNVWCLGISTKYVGKCLGVFTVCKNWNNTINVLHKEGILYCNTINVLQVGKAGEVYCSRLARVVL